MAFGKEKLKKSEINLNLSKEKQINNFRFTIL